MAKLEKEYKQAQAQIAALHDQIALVEAEAESAALQVSTLEGENGRLEAELSKVSEENQALIAQLTAEKEAAQAKIVELTKERDRALEQAAEEAASAKKAKKAAKKAAEAAAKAAEHAAMLAELQAAENDLDDLADESPTEVAEATASASSANGTTADDLSLMRNSYESREMEARKARVSSVADTCRSAIDRMIGNLNASTPELKSQLTHIVDSVKMIQTDTALSLEAETIAFVQATKLILMSPGNVGACNRTKATGIELSDAIESKIAVWMA